MGLRLRFQLFVLCFGLLGLSLTIISYFNIGVFRLSFLSDEEQRLKYKAQKASLEIVDKSGPLDILTGAPALGESLELPESLFRTSGLRYVELWDYQGKVLWRNGETHSELPHKTLLLERIKARPVPTNLFLDSTLPVYGPMEDPYSERLVLNAKSAEGTISYEYLYPIFRNSDPNADGLEDIPPARLSGFLHLSFRVEASSRRLHIVTAGNLVLAATFLLTTLMALHLWSQHAIQRPLEGLVLSMKQLDEDNDEVQFSSSNELVNLSKTLQRLALERLRYQRELEQLNHDLEGQVEEKTLEMKEFFSLVTHDLRIPLAAVQGYSDLLKRKPEQLTDRQLTSVQRIGTANGHALELVRNLLEAMKIEFGTLQPVMENFSFRELAGEVRDQLNVDESLPEVVLEPANAESEEAFVEADRTRIKRVVTNLLSNAQKHAHGTPQVTLAWKWIARRGLRVQVSDEGSGIPEEHIKRLFEKFTRAPENMGNSSGLGLGLYIVGKILESHGEKVHVKSEVGVGTTFEFYLPFESKDGIPPASHEQAGNGGPP